MLIRDLQLINKYKKYIKYLIAGGTATIVDLVFLFLFYDVLNINIIIAATIAFVIAFFVSFYLQKFWTFRDNSRDKFKTQMAVYFIIGSLNVGINALGMNLLVNKLHVWYLLAQIILSGSIAIYSFLVYNFLIFNRTNQKISS
jgi:putative flippase GtrA